ncbi:MAG: T9SS type A sorting domain-containing protein [Candidatus Marinimicrobia bacterium]|nr:T9SS type A sorting domain-containing protein [Candidatus Neomarinimicrobiota bacterium]
MKNQLRCLLLTLAAATVLHAGLRYSEVLFIPWGTAEGELACRSYAGLQTGPSAFQVLDDRIVILDNENGAIKSFTEKGLQNSEPLPFAGALDLYRDGEALYLATHNAIYRRDADNWMEFRREQDPRNVFMGFFGRDAEMHLRYPGEYRPVSDAAAFRKNGYSVLRLERRLPDRLLFTPGNRTFELRIPDIGSLDYLGAGRGLHYIYAESIIRHAPVLTDRFVLVLDDTGTLKGRITLPRNQFVFLFREFYVSPEGVFYHMQSTEEGIHIIRWEYDPDLPGMEFAYPAEFAEILHFNGFAESEPAIANPPLNKNGATAVAGVERTEALEIADAHVRHVWTATAANIGTTATVTTPEWIQIGENVSIPYKWGGWNTIAQFDAGIAAGKLAGDKNTSVVDWGNSVGNDCSGYVSVCWKTNQKYGTATIGNVSWQLPSVNDLLPGDATNKSGSHIRLFVEWTNDGKLLQAEATSSGTPGWFTRYYTWTVSGITGYVPIRYNNIQGMQAPRPTLLYAVTEGDSVDLAWTADESVDFTAYRISRKLCNEDAFSVVQTLPKGTRSVRIAQPGNTHYDYQISAYIQGETASESGSDIYAVKQISPGKQILFVDGFDRFGGSGSYTYPTHDFAAKTAAALDCRDLAYETCANEAVIEGLVDLKDYELVWWILGDESTADETFSTVEQDSIKSYLNGGGKLFVSGSEIGWDLDNRGSAEDKAFIYEYLKAAYAEDDAGNYSVSGAAGTVFEGLQLAYSQDGSHSGTFPEDYPDVLSTKNGSVIALKYGNSKSAAVSYEGTAPAGTVPGKVMVMGFPFETITTPFSKSELAGFVLRFMGYEIELSTAALLPDDFELYPNYPNPFNPLTTIAYRMGKPAEVRLDIYDLHGAHISCLQQGERGEGRHELQFDGTNLASGVYVYRLSVNQDMQKVQKMTLLK